MLIKVDKRKAFCLLEAAVMMSKRIREITTNVNLDHNDDTAEAIFEIRSELKRMLNMYDKELISSR